MKNRFYLSLFSLLIVACNNCKNATDEAKVGNTKTETPEVKEISTPKISVAEAIRLNAEEGYSFIDVRTPEEIAEGKVEGALEFDVKSDSWQEGISALDKSQPYIVYCRSGVRSALACQMMHDLGFEKIIDMEGGYNAWEDYHKNN